MAKQIAGLCLLEGTFDQLTFYKMEGNYYCRTKSSLTGERVRTSEEFKLTMVHANLMSRASKIGSVIYKALPENWRQFWMYRSFTGEAFSLLKHNPYTDEEVTRMLHKTYVEYWEQWEAANKANPVLQTIKAPKQKPVRKTRKYSLESLLRQKDKSGKPKFRNLEEEQRKRIEKEKKQALYQRTLEHEKQRAEQETRELSNIIIDSNGKIKSGTKYLFPLDSLDLHPRQLVKNGHFSYRFPLPLPRLNS